MFELGASPYGGACGTPGLGNGSTLLTGSD